MIRIPMPFLNLPYCWWQPEIRRSPVEIGICCPFFTRFFFVPNGAGFLQSTFSHLKHQGLIQMSFFLGLGLLAGAMLLLGSGKPVWNSVTQLYTNKIFNSRFGLFFFCEDCFLTKQNNYQKQVQARCRPYQPFSSGCSISEASNKPPCCVSSHSQLSPENIVQNWQVKKSSQLFFDPKNMRDMNSSLFGHKLKSWHLSLLCITLYSSNKACTLLFLAYQVEVSRFLQKIMSTKGTKKWPSQVSFFFFNMSKQPKNFTFRQHLSDVLQDQRLVAGHAEATLRIQNPRCWGFNESHNNPRGKKQQTNQFIRNQVDDTRKQWPTSSDATPN